MFRPDLLIYIILST